MKDQTNNHWLYDDEGGIRSKTGLLLGIGMLLVLGKTVSVIALLGYGICLFRFWRGQTILPMAIAFVVFWILQLQPVDIQFKKNTFGFGFKKLVYGYPTPDAKQRARTGEVVLGGCLVPPFPASYLITW